MSSRRSFLAQIGLALSALVYRLPGQKQQPPLAFELFFDHDRMEIMRGRFMSDPLFADLREELNDFDRAEEWKFIANGIQFNDHLYHINRLAVTAQKMGFFYNMTANEDAGILAAESIRNIMKFPKWDYFLESGSDVISIQRGSACTVAISLCSDWLGDLISKGEREKWLRAMGEKGCETCFRSIYGMRYPDRVVGWSVDPTSTYFEHRPGDRIDLSNWPHILDRTNLKAVPASALAIGAIAYETGLGANADTERWIEQAVYSLSDFRNLYARDGSYDENLSYADYTSLHIAQATHLLAAKKGIDLYDIINWPGLMEFATEMTLPTATDLQAIVNFGDAGRSMFSAVPFWVAATFHDEQAQWFGMERSMGQNEWSLIWYNPDKRAKAPPSTPHIYHSELDWIVGRTGYAPEDLVVAMRSGGPSNHEHADRNSIILKCFGEHLVADPYRPPYSFSDPAWMLRTTAGHSAMLIDGQGHQYHDGSEGTNPSDARARIVRKLERSTYMLWASDATPAYKLVMPDVASATRTVVMLQQLSAVVIVDKVIKDSIPSTIQARFFAFNMDGNGTIEVADNAFTIRRPLARLRGIPVGPGSQKIERTTLPIPEDVAAMHPAVDVGTIEASLEPLLITVLVPHTQDTPDAIVRWSEEEGRVVITISHAGKAETLQIYDDGTLPEIEVTG